MMLDEWMKQAKKSAAEFAREIGCSAEYVRLIKNGQRVPSAPMAQRFIAATGGKVTLDDLVGVRQ